MGPEERLEALRDDARWRPIALYPEHGRMPAPVRAQPWRVLVGTAIVLAVVAAVFGGVSVLRSAGNQAVPMPLVGHARPETRAPTTMPVAQLLGEAKLPDGATPGADDSVPLPFANDGSVCGAISADASFWTVAGLSADDAMSWLTQNRPTAMRTGAGVWEIGSGDAADGGYVLDAIAPSGAQGLLFTVASIPEFGVAIRVDALDLPHGDACVADRLSNSGSTPSSAATAAEEQAQEAALQAARSAAEHAFNAGH